MLFGGWWKKGLRLLHGPSNLSECVPYEHISYELGEYWKTTQILLSNVFYTYFNSWQFFIFRISEANPSYHLWVYSSCLDTIRLWHMFSCLILCFFFSRAFHESTMTKPPSCFDWDNIGQRWKMWFRSSYFPYVFNRYFHHLFEKSWVSIFIRQPLLTFSNSNHIKSYTSFEDVFDWTPCHPPKSSFFFQSLFFCWRNYTFIQYHMLELHHLHPVVLKHLFS